jgi:hypothetical protein
MAVAESLDLLAGNEFATAIRADLRDPQAILDHPEVRRRLDPRQPVGLLLVSVLHFVTDDAEASDVLARWTAALTPGGYLVLSHAAAEAFDHLCMSRNRAQVERLFDGLELVDPGVVRLGEWRPDPDEPAELADGAGGGGHGSWAGVARKG